MKKSVFLALGMVLFLASSAFALDYYGALRAAQQEKKPVLLYFFSQSCGYCTKMDRETLADKEIGSMLRRDFVFLRVDTDRWTDLAALYRIRGTPTSWFLDSSGQRIQEVPGYIEKGDYKTLLQYVKGKHYKTMDIQAYFKKAGRG